MNSDVPFNLPIKEVYVPLTTTLGRLDECLDELRESDRSNRRRDRNSGFDRDIELSDVFRESESRNDRGIVLLGEPGAGKTTGARQLAWRLASGESSPEEIGLPAGMRPVFLRLAES
jgi:predicted NACHT family NTPase